MIGKISKRSLVLAASKGINLRSGSLRRDGRVILLARTFPASHKSGSALRARVVWWLHTGEAWRGHRLNVHHKNGNRRDDRISNLQKLKHSHHSSIHGKREGAHIHRKCKNCGEPFSIERWRLKDKSRGTFCSQFCYQEAPKKKKRIEISCEECRQKFLVKPFYKFRRFCSNRCSATFIWRMRK